MINEPLFTATEAQDRALELIAQFDKNPDVLSPNEQALAMQVKVMTQAGKDVVAVLSAQVARAIEALAESHYARDIRGQLALDQWCRLAQTYRDQHPMPDWSKSI